MSLFKKLINIPISIYHYKRGHLILPYLPNALWIEPTNICNLKCIMCPNSIVSQKNPGFMELELFRKIIDEAKDFVSYAVLCISGESLLNKDFPEMVKYAKEKGIHTYLSTNCTVLTPELSRRILKAGLDWINFSFDGCTKEIYEKVRVNAKFEESLRNVIDFLKIKKELVLKTQAELQILIMNDEGLKNYKENISRFLLNFSGLPLNSIQLRRPSTWGKFFLNSDKFGARKLSKRFSPCSYLWSSLHILWDGRIVACTSDFFAENVLGKFPEKSLREIWNDVPMRNFRKAMISNNYLHFNKNCQMCDSLWEEAILGLPAGIRGISAITISYIFGKTFFALFKKLAQFLNPNFAMEVIEKNRKI